MKIVISRNELHCLAEKSLLPSFSDVAGREFSKVEDCYAMSLFMSVAAFAKVTISDEIYRYRGNYMMSFLL
jgi:hypothetical protein